MGGGWYDTRVKKTSLYLEPDLDRALARAASAQGVTKAELVRRTLARAVAKSIRPKPSAAGVFDGPADLAGDVDRHLAESDFGKR